MASFLCVEKGITIDHLEKGKSITGTTKGKSKPSGTTEYKHS